MVKSFLPAMRGLVAHNLSKKGFSQSKISKLFGVSQAAVSQYLAKPTIFYAKKTMDLGIDAPESEHYAALLSEDLVTSKVAAVYTLYTVWRKLLIDGRMCDPHRAQIPGLAQCDVCMTIMGSATKSDERSAVIEEIQRAVKLLEDSNTFPQIMPEVSVNLVMAVKSPKGEADVAAIPGRIVKVKGKARSLLAPEFGASHHMARVLLAVQSKFPEVRATMNVRFDKNTDTIITKKDLKHAHTDPSDREGPDPVLWSIGRLIAKTRMRPDVIIDAGGLGIEPIAYLFADNATNVVRKAIGIAQGYASLERIN